MSSTICRWIFVLLVLRSTICLVLPTELRVGRGPEEVKEMVKVTVSVFLSDENGTYVNSTGSETWYCSVSLVSGPGSLSGTTQVPFVSGVASFSDIRVSQAGGGYQLQWQVEYPASTGVSAVRSFMFRVGDRPLGLSFEDESEMVAEKLDFSLNLTIMDLALGLPAEEEVLVGLVWSCSILLVQGEGVLVGNTSITVQPGEGSVVFPSLQLEGLGEGRRLRACCTSQEYTNSPSIEVDSGNFIVFPFPDTGLLRRTTSQLRFLGPYHEIEPVIVIYNELGLVGQAACSGCPVGVLPKLDRGGRRKRGAGEEKRGSSEEKSGASEECQTSQLDTWDPCTSPIFLQPDLSCNFEYVS